MPAGGDCSMIVPIAAGSTRSPTAPSVSPASDGGRASVAIRSSAAAARAATASSSVISARSGISTVHGVATVICTAVPTGASACGAGDWATIEPGLAPLSWVGRGSGARVSPTAPRTTAAAAGVRPRRSGTWARIGTATVSATPVPFWTRAPGGGEAASTVPDGAALCCSTRSSSGTVRPSCASNARAWSSCAPTSSGTVTVWVATTSVTRAPSLTTVAAAGACSSTLPGGPASVSSVETGPSCRPAAGEGLARRRERLADERGHGDARPLDQDEPELLLEPLRLPPVDRRRRVARDEEAGARGVGGGAAEQAGFAHVGRALRDLEGRARLDGVRLGVVGQPVRVEPLPVGLGGERPRRVGRGAGVGAERDVGEAGEPRLAGEQTADELARARGQRLLERQDEVALERVARCPSARPDGRRG